ncbi:unnamed protein product [Coffea canephora]|uniref:Uncharacterized protein n=1 Tax=Coffea canephora TaxID=49390 RepID=A0A068V6A7_COFCA|nr:unnamed protein product [Coffea canephora]
MYLLSRVFLKFPPLAPLFLPLLLCLNFILRSSLFLPLLLCLNFILRSSAAFTLFPPLQNIRSLIASSFFCIFSHSPVAEPTVSSIITRGVFICYICL